jgi:hypothetical protein
MEGTIGMLAAGQGHWAIAQRIDHSHSIEAKQGTVGVIQVRLERHCTQKVRTQAAHWHRKLRANEMD